MVTFRMSTYAILTQAYAFTVLKVGPRVGHPAIVISLTSLAASVSIYGNKQTSSSFATCYLHRLELDVSGSVSTSEAAAAQTVFPGDAIPGEAAHLRGMGGRVSLRWQNARKSSKLNCGIWEP